MNGIVSCNGQRDTRNKLLKGTLSGVSKKYVTIFRFKKNLTQILGYQICQQTVYKISKFYSHFQLKSQLKGRKKNEF